MYRHGYTTFARFLDVGLDWISCFFFSLLFCNSNLDVTGVVRDQHPCEIDDND